MNFYIIKIQDIDVSKEYQTKCIIIWYKVLWSAFGKEIRFTSLITLQVAYVRSISFIYVVQKS